MSEEFDIGIEYASDTPSDAIQAIMDTYGITLKQALFCEYYFITHSATKAARLAQYANPNVSGSRLLTYPKVRRYLAVRFASVTAAASEVLARLTRIARADIAEYLDANGKVTVKDAALTGDTSVIKKYESKTRKTRMGATETTVTLELHDPLKAAELLGKHYRLFADVQAKPDEAPTVAELSEESLRREAQAAIIADADLSDDLRGLIDLSNAPLYDDPPAK